MAHAMNRGSCHLGAIGPSSWVRSSYQSLSFWVKTKQIFWRWHSQSHHILSTRPETVQGDSDPVLVSVGLVPGATARWCENSPDAGLE